MDELLYVYMFFVAVFTGGMFLVLVGTILFSQIPYWFDQLKDTQ